MCYWATMVPAKDQLLRSLTSGKSEDVDIVKGIQYFLDQKDLLPEGFQLADITADGLFFTIPTGAQIHLYELSEGIKSVISLALELIRLLIETYGVKSVFGHFLDNDLYLVLFGVLLHQAQAKSRER